MEKNMRNIKKNLVEPISKSDFGTRKPKFEVPCYSLYLKATNKCDITYVQCKKNARQQKLQEQQQKRRRKVARYFAKNSLP